MRGAAPASLALFALMLGACGTVSDRTSASQTTTDLMIGRWILTAPNAPTCGINFSGAPAEQEGTLVPEGGCPERFFLGRSWTLNQNVLTIRDDGGQTLAEFTFANGTFSGKSAAGTPISLTRQGLE